MPMDEPVSGLESEMEFVEPEFILEERVRYPAGPCVATQEPEELDQMTVETESHPCGKAESMVEDEKGLEQEMSDMPDEDLGEEPLSCSHPVSEISTPAKRPEERPVPAPRKRKEGTAQGDTPIPIPRRSQRTAAGKNRNPFNLPMSACNTVAFSPDVLSQVLAGMVLYSSQLKGTIDT